jgi:hypothetical protein
MWSNRAWWAASGILAGVSGIVSNMVFDDQNGLTDEQMASGAGVIEHLNRTNYHVGVIAGWVAIAGLFVMAAGWRRTVDRMRDDHLAWLVIPYGLLAAAASLLLGYGVKGALAEYLPGGSNDDNFPAEAVYQMFVFNDNAPWVGWWGVLFAAGAVTWLSFRRRGSIPPWLGILGGLIVLHATVVMVGTGAVAIAGLTGPIWLLASSSWLLVRGTPRTGRSSGGADHPAKTPDHPSVSS